MNEINITLKIKSFEKVADLPATHRQLLEAAREGLDKSYAPYSGFQVGAAVLLANGEILYGGNQENAAYPMCLCAERVALASAAALYPSQPVEAIAITVRNVKNKAIRPAAPCGACRQVICETEYRYNNDITIILQGEEGPVYVVNSGKALLPLSFDRSYL